MAIGERHFSFRTSPDSPRDSLVIERARRRSNKVVTRQTRGAREGEGTAPRKFEGILRRGTELVFAAGDRAEIYRRAGSAVA